MTDRGSTVGGGRYRLDERLDSGGLSTVWRGTDLDRDDPVAIKCESDGFHEPEQVRRHFRQELRWFRHFADTPTPGSLVHFVDGSIDASGSYVVTELIRGGSLAAQFDGDRTPGFDAFRSLGGPVCRGVAFLHDNGVVHLDVKPANVLDRRRGPPAVIDLNSAVSREAETSTLFHHDPFKPPELTPTDAREEPAGPWSDVFALGKLLYYLLTGDVAELAEPALADWESVDPRLQDIDCPPGLADAIVRATEPRPDDRFADAVALVDALAPFLYVPNRVAAVEHESSGVRIRVRPGDSLGRFSTDRWLPAVVIPDRERFLSPTHATIGLDGDAWILHDRSLNGTYVEIEGEWQYVLSEDGIDRRNADGAPLPERRPPSAVPLDDGARIAPVSPEYGCPLIFRAELSSHR